MPFSIVSTSTVLARNAGALYNVTLSNSLMTSLATQAGSTNAGMDAVLNSIYVNSVGNATAAAVADELILNLGITSGTADAKAYIVGVLNATPVAARGAAVNGIISMFSQLTDAIYGGFAATYNTKIANSEAYSAVAANTAVGSFANVASVNVPAAFTLTTGIDNTTVATVNGLIDQNTAANTTWGLSDSIAATNGTVNLSLITNAANIAGYNTSGVTKLAIKPIDAVNTATASSFDVGGMTGLTNVTVQNASVIGTTSDSLTIGSLPAAASVTISGNGQYQDVTANYVTAATAGTADTVTLSVTGRNGAATVGTGFETAAITGGTAARLASLTTTTVKTVNVSGSDLRIDAALDSTVTSIDASKATGAINLAAAPGATFSAKGGTGTADVLAVSTLTSSHTVTGFETVVATAAATYDLTGTDTTNLGVGVGAGAVSFTNASATENNIVIGGLQQRTTAPAATGNLTTGGTIAYALKTATGAADTLNIAVNNGGTASTGTMTIGGTTTATSVENIVITAADWKAVTFGGIEMSTTTTSASNLTVAATAANMTFGTINLTQGTATVAAANVINFGAVTGTTSATVGTTTAMTFTGGTGVDTTTVGVTGLGSTSTYNMGAGNDVVTIAANAANAATSVTNINGEAGDDLIDITGTNVTTLTLNIDGGAGVDSLRINGASSFIDSLVGVEKLININNTTTTIAASSTAANNSLEITAITNTAVTAFTTTVGQIVSIAGVTAIGTVGATTLTLTGSTGAETLTGSSTVGTGIVGGAGNDIITGGAGDDLVNGGTGVDTIALGTGTDAVISTSDGTGAITPTAGSITVNTAFGALAFSSTGMDTVSGINSAGDTVQIYTTGTTAIVTAGTVLTNSSTLGAAGTVGNTALIRGNNAAGVFTASSTGTDTALVWDADGTGAGVAFNAIILVGYVDAGTADTISNAGLFTVVA